MREHKAALAHEKLGKVLERFGRALAMTDEEEFKLEASIKLFEMSYELFWKALRQDLENDGKLEGTSPRAVIKRAYEFGWLRDEEPWLSMLGDRNVTTHTYKEEEVRDVMTRLPSYHAAMTTAHDLLKRDF